MRNTNILTGKLSISFQTYIRVQRTLLLVSYSIDLVQGWPTEVRHFGSLALPWLVLSCSCYLLFYRLCFRPSDTCISHCVRCSLPFQPQVRRTVLLGHFRAFGANSKCKNVRSCSAKTGAIILSLERKHSQTLKIN